LDRALPSPSDEVTAPSSLFGRLSAAIFRRDNSANDCAPEHDIIIIIIIDDDNNNVNKTTT